jgi:hypothetical protein
VTVTISRDGESVTDSETMDVGPTCQDNSSFYINEEMDDNFSCGDCHEDGGDASFVIDGTSFTTMLNTFNDTTKLSSASDPYVFANMPAMVDRTPGLNTFGGEYNHSDGLKWPADSGTHFRVIELAYRINEGFSCP